MTELVHESLARMRAELASVGATSASLARLGALVCAALTLVVGAVWLFDDALPGQDHWATLNSSQSYAERTFPADDFIGSSRVAEDARLWMPPGASYRIVVGAGYKGGPWDWAARNFLAGFLFPRHRRDSGAANWVFCLGCEVSALGARFQVLSDGGNGVVFGRSGP